MKNLRNLAESIMMLLCIVVVNVIFAACSEDYSAVNRINEILPDEPTPAPEKPDTTTTDTIPDEPTIPTEWKWNIIADQTVNFDTATEWVESNNISLLARENGTETETKRDSATLRYQFGVTCSAPIRVVTEASDTTVYTGKGRDNVTYGEFYCQGTDSLRTVTTNVVGGFQTNYYTVGLTTNRTEGYSLQGGKWVPYKNVTETSVMSSIWHEPMVEIELNDSIFNRETVHNCITITLRSEKMQTWTVRREKVVVVDHFIKVKEEEKPEPEKVKADFWANNLKGFISCTKVWRDDTQSWSDAYLFECKDTYEIILANYIVTHKDDKDVETLMSVERKSVKKSVCPASSDYNGVIQVGGNFYPAAIAIQSDGWDVIGYINGKAESQTHADQFANNSGIKNQNKNNNAKPSPFITTTKVENKVNGKLVIKVTAKTTTHTGVYTVADSSLK